VTNSTHGGQVSCEHRVCRLMRGTLCGVITLKCGKLHIRFEMFRDAVEKEECSAVKNHRQEEQSPYHNGFHWYNIMHILGEVTSMMIPRLDSIDRQRENSIIM
jgi:hypothetical protein